MTRSPAIFARLLGPGLLMVLAGCSSMGLGRPKVLPGVRTTALVGDKPVAVVAGLPGESIEIDTRFPGRKEHPRERISGRVVDASGRPVPNALVRLTDASGIDARDHTAETDRAGGFTIHNLRPGVRYHLVAEGPDGSAELSGEQEAEAPQSNVRIALSAPDSVSGRDEPSYNTRTVSDRSTPDEALPLRSPSRAGPARDEVESRPPAREAEALASRDELPKPSASSPRDAWRSAASNAPDIATETISFTEPAASTADRSAFGLPVEPEEGPDPLPPAIDRPEPFQAAPTRGAIVGATPARPAEGRFEIADDPQIEPAPPPQAPSSPSSSSESFIAAPAMSSGPVQPVAEPSADPPPEPIEHSTAPPPEKGFASEPPSLTEPPAPEPPPEPVSAPDPSGFDPAVESSEASLDSTTLPPLEEPSAPAPKEGPSSENAAADQPDDGSTTAPPPLETPEPSASGEDALPPIQPPDDDLDLIKQPGRPTGSFESPSEVSRLGADPRMTARAPEPERPTWSDLTSQSARRRASAYPPSRRLTKPDKPSGLGLIASLRGDSKKPTNPKASEVVRASCSFDKRENRLVDFTLPDLQGRPVRFRDIDADYVLIDFWGTWCGPCLRSIPHLVQLQNRYDPKRLRVIGVAYEQTGPQEGVKNVRGTMRQLGINYPVLMGQTGDEPCPVQSAFHIQAYPTMVLVDRHGRILWRESGSNPMTMTRLDRVIASNTKADAGVLRR